MKKLLIACSMISAVALVACATDNMVNQTCAEQSWFGAKVTSGQIAAVRGGFQIKEGGESTYKVSDNKIEIDSELDDPVSFVLEQGTASLTTTLACVSFELDPAVVPYSARPTTADLANVKVAFALCENEARNATNFCAWTGSAWTNLNFTIPTETYELTMKFNESPNAKKVQFSIEEETSDWISYTNGLATPKIDFVGSGKIKELAAAQLKLEEEEIVTSHGSVTIAGDDMVAMEALKSEGELIVDVLNADVKDKFPASGIDATLTVAEAYAIGMIYNNDGTIDGTMVAKGNDAFNVKADATATTTDGIKVGFVTDLTPNDRSAAVTYTLKGSADGTTYSEIAEMVGKTDINDIKIPTGEITGANKYRYFKVVTTVTLKNAQ